MDFFTKKRWVRPISVLLTCLIALGVHTGTQPPKVATDEIVVGPAEAAVQGTDQKGYIAVPEGENWEELSVILTDPDGNEKTVEAVLDDDANYFLFEAETDQSGTWSVNELQIVEDGQTVVQEVQDTTIEVFDTVDEAFDAPGPQILAPGLEETAMLSFDEYRAALANITAVDAEGDPIPVRVHISGAMEQAFEFYNDGQERSASEPIRTDATGLVQIALHAEGAESLHFEIQLVADPEAALHNKENYVSLLGLAEAHALFAEAVSQYSPPEVMVPRLGGATMYETATMISGTAVSYTQHAVLVNATAFPDALASSSLTKTFNAPILYITKNEVHPTTRKELQRLGVKNVFLIGGPAVISDGVERELAKDFNIRRLWGPNAIGTANEVAKFGASQRRSTTALLANVRASQDGLIAGAYASHNAAPIFYTQKDSIDAATLQNLSQYQRVIIVGGVNVVSSAVQQELLRNGIPVERAAGENRYETAVAFARRHFTNSERAVIASGADRNMVDALTGSFLGGTKYAPILLTDPKKMPDALVEYYNSKDVYVSYLLGGPNAVSDGVLQELRTWTATPPWTEPPVSQEPDPYPSDRPVRIMLDPGHGWNYNQGVNQNYYEGNQMLYFSHYLRLELEKYGFEVDITRMPRGAYDSPYQALLAEKDFAQKNQQPSINNQIFSLTSRGQSATDYDLLLSLHSNAPFDIAASEIFDSVTNPNKELAERLLETITDTFRHDTRGVKYRYNSSGANWYGILRDSGATHALLIEHGFHTSRSDVSKLLDFDFLKTLAAAEARTLAEFYGLR